MRVLDNFITGREADVPDGTDLIRADIRDLDAVREAFQGVEVVFHQAAIRSVPRSLDDPTLTDRCNVQGTLNVLIAATDAGVNRVVYASSSSAYGDQGEGLNREDAAPNPLSPYAVSKLAGEYYCRVWNRIRSLSTVSLRYFNVFGPGQHAESLYSAVFPSFISSLSRDEPPEVHWDGEQSRDFTFIDDVVAANLAASKAGDEASGEVFNVGAGRAKSVNQVYETICSVMGRRLEPIRLPKRAGDVRHTNADISKAKKILGWQPEAGWDEAVEATVSWFEAPGLR